MDDERTGYCRHDNTDFAAACSKVGPIITLISNNYTLAISGVARNYVYGGRPEGWGTEGAELGAVWGGVSPAQPTIKNMESVVSTPSGVRSKAPAANAFLDILGHRTLLVDRKTIHFQLSSAAWTTDPTIIFFSLDKGIFCTLRPYSDAEPIDSVLFFNMVKIWNGCPLPAN